MNIRFKNGGKLSIGNGNGAIDQVVKPVKRVKAIIGAAVAILIGILCIAIGASQLHKMNSGKYVEITATVIQTETRYVTDSDDANKTREEYTATVEYTVDGQKYTEELSTPELRSQGQEMTVLYNVDRPSDVVLPGNSGNYIFLGIGVVLVLLGAFALLKNLRRVL